VLAQNGGVLVQSCRGGMGELRVLSVQVQGACVENGRRRRSPP